MIRFKPEVRVGHFNAHLFVVLEAASWWSVLHKVDVQVTSINDPAAGRVANSLHSFDLAVDLDPLSDTPSDRQSLADHFGRHLDPQFDVVFERDHVHVEYDTRRGPLRQSVR